MKYNYFSSLQDYSSCDVPADQYIGIWIYKDQMKVVLWINILGLYFYAVNFKELAVISGLMILLLFLYVVACDGMHMWFECMYV